MKRILCLLPLLAVLASAQSFDRESAVNRLSADLANLKSIPADSGFSLVRGCLPPRHTGAPRPEECGPVDRISEDLARIHSSQAQHLVVIGLSDNIVTFMSGRDLDPVPLSVFTNSLVDALLIADKAVEVRRSVLGSQEFRDSIMRAYTALMALGVDKRSTEIVLGSLVRNAEQWSKPPAIIPIPPAYR